MNINSIGSDHISASIVQPVLTQQELETSEARYIIGSGTIAKFVLAHFSESARAKTTLVDDVSETVAHGRPVIDFRTFCSNVDRHQPVILATDAMGLLTAILAARQLFILDAREFYFSCIYRSAEKSRPSSKLIAISTVPRSGTYRIRYFLFALNELLLGRSAPSSPHKLFLYRLADWSNPDSPYFLAAVVQFLRTNQIQSGHFVPPGSLSLLSSNIAVARELSARASRFTEACRASPLLGLVSHPLRPWKIEPTWPAGSRYIECRYALVARNILDQIVSMLTYYELMVPLCRRLGATRWSIKEFIEHCFNKCRAFVFSGLNGMVPFILYRAVQFDVAVTDIVFENGAYDSLIVDYALQAYSAHYCQNNPSMTLTARVFSYDALAEDELAFFAELMAFFRGARLDSTELAVVERACMLTSKEWTKTAEMALRHSLSFNEGLQNVFRSDTHMTDSHGFHNDIAAVRMVVRSKVFRNAGAIQRRLSELMSAFQRAEQRSTSLGDAAVN